MGPVLIRVLYRRGVLKDSADFFYLTREDLKEAFRIIHSNKQEDKEFRKRMTY